MKWGPTDLFDLFPVPWGEPAVREMRDVLAMTFFRSAEAQALAAEAGIPVWDVTWDRPARMFWTDILNEAVAHRVFPALVEQVVRRAPRLEPRIVELLAAQPVVGAPSPSARPEWTNFRMSARERQIVEGRPTLLDVAFLEQGLRCAAAVCRLTVVMGGRKYYGTAFRIGVRTLLTNHHVLYDWDMADVPAVSVLADFGHELDAAGRLRTATTYEANVATIRGEKADDFAVIRTVEPLADDIPILPIDTGATVDVNDRVSIVQHPFGLEKKVGLHHNLVRHADDCVVQYWTDTERGSSGSPVFDQQWNVVALHHQWVDAPEGDVYKYRNQGRAIPRVASRLTVLGAL